MENIGLLVLHVIESFLVGFAGNVLFNFTSFSKTQSFIVFGCIHGVIVYFTRSLFIIYRLPMGLHTLVLLAVYVILLKYMFTIKWRISSIVSLTGFFIITISEILLAPLYMKIFNWTTNDILANTINHITIGLLDAIPLILICIYGLFKRRHFNLFNVNDQSHC